mmetsp:Transcript_13007/g.33036  ORF Transcript_13007/g.33036 Transcript_13007/m.33036 type:complete len:242 (+) Transcript_13007:215-940(+)
MHESEVSASSPSILRRLSDASPHKRTARRLALVRTLQQQPAVRALPSIERYPIVIIKRPRPPSGAASERQARARAPAPRSGFTHGGSALSTPVTSLGAAGSSFTDRSCETVLRGAFGSASATLAAGSSAHVTPRSRPRKSKTLERDELEHALLSGGSRLGSGSRGRVAVRKKALQPIGAVQHEGMDTRPELLALAMAEHEASPWQPPERGESDEGRTLSAPHSADDCAAASVLAMLFECAS